MYVDTHTYIDGHTDNRQKTLPYQIHRKKCSMPTNVNSTDGPVVFLLSICSVLKSTSGIYTQK